MRAGRSHVGSITIVRLIIGVFGGSWVVISGVIRPLRWVISIVTLLFTLLLTALAPPSTDNNNSKHVSRFRGPASLWNQNADCASVPHSEMKSCKHSSCPEVQMQHTEIVNGGTLNFLALYTSSIFQSLNFLGPGC